MSRDRTARARIRHFLATSGPVVDPSGYATGALKDAIGYQGSSVAFIQLVAAMDRDGEIEREIRGKRTYRITGTYSDVALPVPHGVAPRPGAALPPEFGSLELDYDLLARALVRELWTVATAGAPATDVAKDAERDEYAQRLEIARGKLDELLGAVATGTAAARR